MYKYVERLRLSPTFLASFSLGITQPAIRLLVATCASQSAITAKMRSVQQEDTVTSHARPNKPRATNL